MKKKLTTGLCGVLLAASAIGIGASPAEAQMPAGCWMSGPLNWIDHLLGIAGYCSMSDGSVMWFDWEGGYGSAWWLSF
jgi:hypothetical protein